MPESFEARSNQLCAMNWFKALWKALVSSGGKPPASSTSTSSAGPTPTPIVQPFRPSESVIENFTPRAKQALALARKEAERFNHNFVGTEHLLLGLILLGQGVAVTVLKRMGVSLEAVRTEVEKQVGTRSDGIVVNIPYTPRVKKILALAAKEAKALNHTYVGTEHILLGILREGD